MKRSLVQCGVLAGGILFSLLAVLQLPAPYVFIFSAWFLLFMLLAVVHRGAFRGGWLSLAACCLTLAVAEGVFFSGGSRTQRGIDDHGQRFKVRHPILGHVPAPGKKRTHWVYVDEELLYEVRFTTDDRGQRTNPYNPDADTEDALFFFGGSFTYGISVEDEHTLPSQVARDADPPRTVYHLALDGWGAHQMLAILENQLEKNLLNRKHERYTAVYQAIIPHIERTAGKEKWYFNGPRYVLDESGVPTYDGPFYPYPVSRLLQGLFRSHIVRQAHRLIPQRTGKDIELYLATIDRAREVFEENYPGFFVVLLWNLGEPEYPEVLAGLKRRKITVYEVSDILPGFDGDREAYLYPVDLHPTAETYKKLAAFILETF